MVNAKSMDRKYCKIYESMVSATSMDRSYCKILEDIVVNGKCKSYEQKIFQNI